MRRNASIRRPDAYRRINPLGMVPALQDGGPRVMTQADAILKYIAARHPEAMLGAGEGLAAEFEMDEALGLSDRRHASRLLAVLRAAAVYDQG